MNFYNTTTKLSIPHEFIQRNVPKNKRMIAIVEPYMQQNLEQTSSTDSTGRTGIGKFN